MQKAFKKSALKKYDVILLMAQEDGLMAEEGKRALRKTILDTAVLFYMKRCI